jgi:hypothetical protein
MGEGLLLASHHLMPELRKKARRSGPNSHITGSHHLTHHQPHLCITPAAGKEKREGREGKEKRKGEEEGSWKQQ